jgi:hypothetical protein
MPRRAELVEQKATLASPGAADTRCRGLRGATGSRPRQPQDPDDVALTEGRDRNPQAVRPLPRVRRDTPAGRDVIEPGQRGDAAEGGDACLDDRVVAPARRMPDRVAYPEAVGVRLDHLPDGVDPVHRRLEWEGGEVAGRRLVA